MDSIFVLRNLLDEEKLTTLREKIAAGTFIDGKRSASGMAAAVKNNEQLEAADTKALLPLIDEWVARNPHFVALSFPRAVSTVLVSRCREGMGYGLHSDNAVLNSGYRSDISFTLSPLGPPPTTTAASWCCAAVSATRP